MKSCLVMHHALMDLKRITAVFETKTHLTGVVNRVHRLALINIIIPFFSHISAFFTEIKSLNLFATITRRLKGPMKM